MRRVQLALYHSQLVFIGVYFRTSKRVFGIALDQPKKILRWLETEGLSLTPGFMTRAGVHVLIDDERLDSFQLSSTAAR